MATVYDGNTGATVAQVNLGSGFINDVIITRAAAYFTNSYIVDPETGVASSIDVGGVDVGGDGLVLAGKTLYVNENSLNRIAKIQPSPDLSSGTVRIASALSRFGS